MSRESRGEYVCCRLGGLLVGIDLDRVQEINRHTEATFVPLMDPCLRGVINLRGSLVTVLDLGIVVRGEAVAAGSKARTVVLEMGDEINGLVVDEVGDVVAVEATQIEPLPSHIPVAQRRWFSGMVQMTNELLLLLDISAVNRLTGQSKSAK